MVRFLRLRPFAYLRCARKGCSCECFDVQCDPGTQKCRECKHSRMLHRSIFTSEILTPIRQHGFRDRGKVAMETLRFEVLQKLLLRRTKLAVGIGLPPMHVSEHKVKLSSPERHLYDSVRAQSLAVFEDYATNLTKNFCHVFALLARQRQAACHPLLVNHNKVFSGRCPLCQGMAETVLECGHGFHEDCWADYVRDRLHDSEGEEEPSCLACAWGAMPGKEFLQELSGKLRSSSKLDAVASRIEQLLREDPAAKFLVFSQFTHFLEIAHWKLKKWGAGLLCGNTQVKKRQGIVESFQSDPKLRILLISLQVGGEGLNLQAANFVLLLDPWWNPAAELQAMQRAHRIGQSRPVQVIRFVSQGTIEEKILELQGKKQKIFDSTIEGNNEALLRLTGEDIQRLFRE